MSETPFVSRAGGKLEHALVAFDVDVDGLVCADFGCNVGGFTDVLLRRGAALVHAVDTGYGTLAWTLRNDDRVVVRERSNALHAEAPEGGVDLVVVDLGWTPQRHAVPAALRWLRPGPGHGRIVTLLKPHYELDDAERRTLLHDGRLDEVDAERVVEATLGALPALGVRVLGCTRSPLRGGKSSRRGTGNAEWLALLEPAG